MLFLELSENALFGLQETASLKLAEYLFGRLEISGKEGELISSLLVNCSLLNANFSQLSDFDIIPFLFRQFVISLAFLVSLFFLQ